jgi:KDO2-lipid IV(A) lauroyltransferase
LFFTLNSHFHCTILKTMKSKNNIRRKIRYPVEIGAFKLGALFIPLVPRILIVALSNAVGELGYYVCARERTTGLANLATVFGGTKTDREKRTILKKSFASFAMTTLDLFWFSRNTKKRLARYHRFAPENSPYLERRAQVLITAHTGNWELIGLESGLRGLNLASIAATTKNKAVDQYLIQLRQQTGQIVIPRENALRKLIHRFRNDGKVAFVLDQNTPPEKGGIWVNFLGTPTPMSPAPAHLAYRTGTDIILLFSKPLANGRYETYTGPIITPPPFCKELDKNEVAQKLTQQIVDVISQHIIDHPESWIWSYKYWRDIFPGDTPDRYPFYSRPVAIPKTHKARQAQDVALQTLGIG